MKIYNLDDPHCELYYDNSLLHIGDYIIVYTKRYRVISLTDSSIVAVSDNGSQVEFKKKILFHKNFDIEYVKNISDDEIFKKAIKSFKFNTNLFLANKKINTIET